MNTKTIMHVYDSKTGKEIGIFKSKYSDGTQWLIEIKDRYDSLYVVEANRLIENGDHYTLITDY